MTAQSSSSESKSIVSSTPLKVNVGAAELDISILKMKSRAPSSGYAGSCTTTGVAEDDTCIVVIAWSLTAHVSDPLSAASYAVSSAYLLDPPPLFGTYIDVGTLSTLIVATRVPVE